MKKNIWDSDEIIQEVDTVTVDGQQKFVKRDYAGRMKISKKDQVKPPVNLEDMDNLRHMLGANSKPKASWGFRNHFAPGGKDIESMKRLEAAGYVIRGKQYYGTNFFHATESGCRAIGLKAKQIKRALGGRD